ncbi:MAG: hypothetical protein RL597_887, partial [Pseudomonadota bacterium]
MPNSKKIIARAVALATCAAMFPLAGLAQ